VHEFSQHELNVYYFFKAIIELNIY